MVKESYRLYTILGVYYADTINDLVRLEGLFRGLGHNVTVEIYDKSTKKWNRRNG
jgi:hypothetical protein